MTAPTTSRKILAAEASKTAILTAAEVLFADKGYDATSLQAICDKASVARGTPGYFFGSKEGLYRAVLERSFARSRELVTVLRARARQPHTDAQDLLEFAIESVFDFLVTNPMFIRMTEWEALHGGQHLGDLPVLLEFLRDALDVLHKELHWQGNAEQFLIDLTALCWFPLAHATTFLKPLGIDIHDPAFLTQRKQHVVQVLLAKKLNPTP